jgi:hypothetical protein
MSKYQVLARPYGQEPSLNKDEFGSVDEAVRFALSMMYGDDFLIVTVVDWKAEPTHPDRAEGDADAS